MYDSNPILVSIVIGNNLRQLWHLKRCGTKINITGCEDFENTFARIESDCTLKFGLWKALRTLKSQICSCIAKARWNVSVGLEGSSCARCCNVWQWRRTVVYVLLHDYVNVCVCNLHSLHHTGRIGSYELHTVHLWSVALLLSHSVLVQFSGWQTQAGWWCLLLGSDPSQKLWNTYLRRIVSEPKYTRNTCLEIQVNCWWVKSWWAHMSALKCISAH